MIADAHVHFFSPAFFRSLAEQKKVAEVGSLLGWELPESAESLADRWVQEMDRRGVSQAMLIASVPNDAGSVNAAVARHPTRFGAVCMVNPLLPSASENAPPGVFLFPAMHGYSLHDDRARAVIAAAKLVYVHCGVLSVGFRKKLGLRSHFDMRFSNPIDLHAIALAISGCPFRDTALRRRLFPRDSHGGGFVSAMFIWTPRVPTTGCATRLAT